MKQAFLVALALGGASAFAPVQRQTFLHGVSKTSRFAEEEAAAPAAAATEEAVSAEEPEEEEPTPPPAPKMTAVEYLDTMYGGVGFENGKILGKGIPPAAIAIAKLGTPATLDFMRAAELKHGRIAMFAFGGWCAYMFGVHFPGVLSPSAGLTFEAVAAQNPVSAFFNLPGTALAQIFGFVSIFEFYEMTHKDGKWVGNVVLDGPIKPNMNKWDILGFTEGKTEEELADIKLKELKNGRLAMWGTLSFVAAATIPHSVPFITYEFPPFN